MSSSLLSLLLSLSLWYFAPYSISGLYFSDTVAPGKRFWQEVTVSYSGIPQTDVIQTFWVFNPVIFELLDRGITKKVVSSR